MKKAQLVIKKNNLLISGFSLIEVLLSVALFAIIIFALLGGIIFGEQSTALSGARERASFLAEESLEAVRNMRDAGFTNLTDGQHGLAISGNKWSFSGTSDTTNIFTRQITISTVNADTKQIASTVTWQQNLQRTGTLTLNTYLTNWQAGNGIPTTTCAQFCQNLGTYNNGVCMHDIPQCVSSGGTNVPGGSIYCAGAPTGNVCCCQP